MADYILFGSFATASIFISVRWLMIPPPTQLDWFVPGEAKWDPKNSWISNTTLLGTVLVAAVKDFKGGAAPNDVTNLNVLFLGLGVLSLLVAMATVRLFPKGEYGTRVRLYLISAAIALWAAIGQALTLGYLVWKAPITAISEHATAVFVGGLILAVIALGGYAWIIMHSQITKAKPPSAPPAGFAANEWPIL